MNILLWIIQGFLAFVFLYSGICKSVFDEKKLVAMGQTGVEGLPLWFIRFIGITEILGATGILLPMALSVLPELVPVSALCFALVMLPAIIIHARRKEYKSVCINIFILALSLLVAYGRGYKGW